VAEAKGERLATVRFRLVRMFGAFRYAGGFIVGLVAGSSILGRAFAGLSSTLASSHGHGRERDELQVTGGRVLRLRLRLNSRTLTIKRHTLKCAPALQLQTISSKVILISVGLPARQISGCRMMRASAETDALSPRADLDHVQ
jgi:hypothetical protein